MITTFCDGMVLFICSNKCKTEEIKCKTEEIIAIINRFVSIQTLDDCNVVDARWINKSWERATELWAGDKWVQSQFLINRRRHNMIIKPYLLDKTYLGIRSIKEQLLWLGS